jgi:hypothetical protein
MGRNVVKVVVLEGWQVHGHHVEGKVETPVSQGYLAPEHTEACMSPNARHSALRSKPQT